MKFFSTILLLHNEPSALNSRWTLSILLWLKYHETCSLNTVLCPSVSSPFPWPLLCIDLLQSMRYIIHRERLYLQIEHGAPSYAFWGYCTNNNKNSLRMKKVKVCLRNSNPNVRQVTCPVSINIVSALLLSVIINSTTPPPKKKRTVIA